MNPVKHCSLRKCFNFRLSEVASSGFGGPRRLVAELLLCFELNIV